MLDFKVLRISQVLNVEELLHLPDALLGQVHHLILFIHNKIPGLLNLLTHDGVNLGKFLGYGSALQLARQHVTYLIQFGGLAALAGNDKRRPGLINQHRVNLIDDGVIQVAKDQLFLIDSHVVTQIVKPQLIVGNICDIARICFLTLLTGHVIENNAHGQSQETVHLAHPLSITLCQIIVDRYNLHTLAAQRVQVGRTGGYQRLAFTSTHLSYTALVKHDAANELYREMLHIQGSFCRLTDSGKCLRQNVIQCFAPSQSFLKDPGLVAQFLI